MRAQPTPALPELLAHTRWVEELAASLVRDPEAAADVAQSTLLVALEHSGSPPENLRSWLSAVLRNRVREIGRRESARGTIERLGARPEALPSADEIVERAECERRVVSAVLALEEPHRSTLLLRYFEGLTPEEIAQRSGAPLATVSSRITRAHARLREKLAGDGIRADWTAALIPILVRPTPSAQIAATSLSGAFVVSTIVKICIAAVVVACVAWWAWPRAAHKNAVATVTPTLPATSGTHPPEAVSEAAPATLSRAPVSGVDVEKTTTAAAPIVESPAAAPVPDNLIGGRIFGRVLRPDGQPAQGRNVRMVHMGKGVEKKARTDDTGTFDERDLGPGVWSLSSWPDEAELEILGKTGAETLQGMTYLSQRTVDLARGAEIEIILGKASEQSVRVHGRVRIGDQPVDGFMSWLPDGKDPMDRQKIATANAKNGYETLLDGPGRYLLVVSQKEARVEFHVDVPAVRELEHDITLPAVDLSGRVVTRDGKPVEAAHVDLVLRAAQNPRHPTADITCSHRTDADGRFKFRCLSRARYSLATNGGSIGKAPTPLVGASAGTDVDLIANARPDEVVIVVATGTKVRGIVRSGTAGVLSAYVFVLTSSGEALNALEGQRTDKEGRFETFALEPGRYYAVAANGATWSHVTRFDVPASGEPEELHLDVSPTAQLTVDLRGVEPAWIDVRDANGCSLSSLLDKHVFNRGADREWSSSEFVYRLPRGNYEVSAVSASDRRTKRISLIAGQEAMLRMAAD